MSSLRPSRYVSSSAKHAPASITNGKNAIGGSSSGTSSAPTDKSALAYLLRYETMVRSQDVEDDATTQHLRPLFDRLIELGSHGTSSSAAAAVGAAAGLIGGGSTTRSSDTAVLTYRAMRVALSSLDAMASATGHDDNDNSMLLTTDRQLMLLLRTVVDVSAEVGGADANDDHHHQEGEGVGEGDGLTYAEFLQVYKVVVGGMQTLQRVPKREDNGGGGNDDNKLTINSSSSSSSSKNDTRLKIRERTLDLIKLFAPAPNSSTSRHPHSSPGYDPTGVSRDSCNSSVSSLPSLPGRLVGRKSTSGGRGRRKSKSRSSSSGNLANNRTSSGTTTTTSIKSKYTDPTDLPRDSTFSTLSMASVTSTVTDADDVRRVLTIKDKTMLNLLSDHAGEMDDLTERMVNMAGKSRRRKRRMIVVGVAMSALGLVMGLILGGWGGGSSNAAAAILANELKYTKRELGQVNVKASKLQKRLTEAEADGTRSASQLYECKSQLHIAGREVEELKVENALVRDEIEACGNVRSRFSNNAATSVVSSKSRSMPMMMKEASSVMAGAAGAVLLPQLAAAVAGGGVRVLAAAGGGLWAGVGLLIGSIVSGALPALLGRK
eukprot:CAMPEP_0178542814 /NCGR_PEP_ID=MMETSP0697-20121206/2253_1 /TAXON_ID=265572 /ORGANISM="Extubocellulus spinifer, Strain CCMP396" /LENGTH=604 /DNA_ID=CAMNT_0020175227 /DNA_START=73 /DNA_END=1891 /DNA_ORIENTATION=+